ncbi:sensor histidine kinase [Tomitella fengzijianii]|uniref:histidine kinase n=1 Tax=Tomitella fengzijianii TaxID=2597660 RepID=A0A516X643_9ACTN|nr:HAMP domain-containing sensor histidine kinase [Tomitella fengzijianii]QDQ98151.1 HAMP domain-containing histidine kinase [Tomitella fengzijianii]
MRRRIRPPSTRARVLGWFMLIVAIALGLNLVVVDQLMHSRVAEMTTAELEHETDRFRLFAERGVDPHTGRPFADIPQLLESYLAEAVPEKDEAMFSVVDGRPAHRTRNDVPVRLDRRDDVVAAASAATAPSVGRIEAGGGAVYAAIPVTDGTGGASGALVVVEYSGAAHANASQVVRSTALASTAALLVAGIIAWFVAGRILAPLRQVRRTAEAITSSDLSRRIGIAPEARDDVARLARTFNTMLDRLEQAFEGQREFLDDAAHELRTPLTIVRGHLELMGDAPQERAETTAMLLEEVDRMQRFIDDLAVLAAADRPDFLTPGRVDLTDLVVGAVARASALASRHWTVSDAADTVIIGDGQRLTQALMQLCANAVRFTVDGDALSIGAVVRDGRVVLTVRDSGPGVPDGLKDRVFDRFTRADGHRRDGSGLGLAIVSSIAAAHGGTAAVHDAQGGSAVFSIRFPARFPDASGAAGPARGAPPPDPQSPPDDRSKEKA